MVEERGGRRVGWVVEGVVGVGRVGGPGGSERMVFRVDRRLGGRRCSAGNVGGGIGLVSGATCRPTGPEERAGPPVVSLAQSLVSVCPVAAPGGSERMVFRVDRRLLPF